MPDKRLKRQPARQSRFTTGRSFSRFLPVVVDVECGGFNNQTDAILEIAAVTVGMDENGLLKPEDTPVFRVSLSGANLESLP